MTDGNATRDLFQQFIGFLIQSGSSPNLYVCQLALSGEFKMVAYNYLLQNSQYEVSQDTPHFVGISYIFTTILTVNKHRL